MRRVHWVGTATPGRREGAVGMRGRRLGRLRTIEFRAIVLEAGGTEEVAGPMLSLQLEKSADARLYPLRRLLRDL